MSGIVGSYFNTRGSGVVAKLGTDGQVFTSTGAGLSQGFEAAPGGGKLGQVVQTVNLDTASLSSSRTNTHADLPGCSVAITPTATSSKVFFCCTVPVSTNTGSLHCLLLRDTTVLALADDLGGSHVRDTFMQRSTGTIYSKGAETLTWQYLDSPSTTSATTYKLQACLGSTYNSTIYLGRTYDNDDTDYGPSFSSSLTVMEILA